MNVVRPVGRLPVAVAAGLLAVALALSGCAGQLAEVDATDTTRIAAAEEPAAPAPTSKPKQKPAVAKKPATYSVAAGKPSPKQAADEASCTAVEACAAVLKDMVAGTDRTWIDRPAKPKVMANGVRLFTYRALRSKLSCSELASALTEVDAAGRTFSQKVGDLEPAQAERVKALSVEVGRELRDERARRCTAKAKEGADGSAPHPQG